MICLYSLSSADTLLFAMQTGQQDEEKREKLQVELKKAQEKNTALKSSLKEFHELDPDELEKLKSESQVTHPSYFGQLLHSFSQNFAFVGFTGGCKPLDR